MPDLETLLRRALLGVTLVLTCLLGFLTSYILLLLTIAAAVHLGRRGDLHLDLPGRIFAGALLGLAAIFALTARQPADMIYVVNFIALLYYGPIASIYARVAHPGNTATVADLALWGAAAGCAFALVDGLLLGHARAGSFTTDPIRLADTALILGFLSLMGILAHTGSRRWIYLAGPLLALITIFLSGSRGALLAFTPMVVIAAFLLIHRKRLAVAIGAASIAAFAVLVGFTDLLGARSASVLDIFADLANQATVGDEAARIRVELYKAGWSAFQQSPIIGHGWARLMSSVEPFLSPADRIHATLPHLHNEILNFAVGAGMLGVGICLALLAIPVAACLRSPRDSQYRARLYGCALLTVSYVMLGLPDTMLSFELHIALYVALSAVLLAYCRDSGPAR